MKILEPSIIQDWEMRTQQTADDPGSLMRTAVNGLHDFIVNRLPIRKALIACGKGNNGNDALWLAYRLHLSGWETLSWLSHPDTERTPLADADAMTAIASASETSVRYPQMPTDFFESPEPVLIIDGILGLGANGAPRGSSAEMLRWLSQHRRPQDIGLSIDSPSGMDATTGERYDPCFQADYTLAIGAVKSGCLCDEALPALGRLSGISIPLAPPAPECKREFFTVDDARALMPHRKVDTYKHRQGTAHIWAGSAGMSGAAVLASRAALRSGAGLVRLFTSEGIIPSIAGSMPEIMVEPVTLSGRLNKRLLEHDSLLIGPGIGSSTETLNLLTEVLASIRSPLVADADALTLLATSLASLPTGSILTPHPGEFSRLMPQRSSGREEAADQFTTLNPQLILSLKGPNTLVASERFGKSYNGSGNPGMATAGSGDVLAGLIAGLLAQGCSPWDAARLGVFWHGLAGDLAAVENSEDAMIAGDLLDYLGEARTCISRP